MKNSFSTKNFTKNKNSKNLYSPFRTHNKKYKIIREYLPNLNPNSLNYNNIKDDKIQKELNILDEIWDELEITYQYRQAFSSYLKNMNEECKNNIIVQEKNNLKKYKKTLINLKKEISLREEERKSAIKNLEKKGVESISDMCSEQFIDFVLDENNLINTQKSKEENNDNKEGERKSTIKNRNEKCEDIIKINNTDEIIEENKKPDELENINSNTNKKINERNNNISKELQDNCIDSIKGEKLINSHLNEINNKPFEEFSNSEIKNNSPIVQKNYDMDEADIIKENKFENNEDKNKEFLDKNENKDNTKLKIANNERISLLEEIILDDEKRFNTEIINNDIAEKIMNISDINID